MFTVLRVYSDNSFFTENCDSISNALSAAAIYLEDPDCISVTIWAHDTDIVYLDYWRN